MITAASVVKRASDEIGNHGEPNSDAPGNHPPSPSDYPDAPIPDPTPVPCSVSKGGSPPRPPPRPPPAPYAQGVCTLHLSQWYYGNIAPSRYGLEIAMKDAAGKQIGWQVHTSAEAKHPPEREKQARRRLRPHPRGTKATTSSSPSAA